MLGLLRRAVQRLAPPRIAAKRSAEEGGDRRPKRRQYIIDLLLMRAPIAAGATTGRAGLEKPANPVSKTPGRPASQTGRAKTAQSF